MMKRKMIGVLAGICLLMLLFCASASAETISRQSDTGAVWTVDTDTMVLTVSGKGATGNITDLDSVKTQEDLLAVLDGNADFMTVEKLIIEEGITEISRSAFSDFFNLYKIELPDGLIKIGEGAFAGDYSISSVCFPESLRSIERNAFTYCSLNAVDLNDGLEYLAPGAFMGCNIRKITIPDSFVGEFPYENYWIDGSVICNRSASFVLDFSQEAAIPENELFLLDCLDYLATEGMLYDTVDEEILQYLGYSGENDPNAVIAFIINRLQMIFDAAEAEGEDYLPDKHFHMICMPDSAQEMYCQENGYDYVLYCDSNGQCGDNAFWTLDSETGIMTVYGSGQVADAESSAEWKKLNVRHLTVKEGITEIGSNAFSYMNELQTVSLPGSVVSIGQNGFGDNYILNRVTFAEPSSLKELKRDAFYGCPLLCSLNLPEGLESIGYRAFYQDFSLEDITLPSTVKSIENYAFAFVPGLKGTLFLPELEKIGEGALSVSGTEAFVINNSHFKTIEGVIYSADGKTLLLYPFGKKDTRFAIPAGVEDIAPMSIRNNYLRTLVVPETLKTISPNAFTCYNLTVLNYSMDVVFSDGTAAINTTERTPEEISNLEDIMSAAYVYRTIAQQYDTYIEASEEEKYLMFYTYYYSVLSEYSGMTVEDDEDIGQAVWAIEEKNFSMREYPYISCLASSAEQANCDAKGYEYSLLTDFYCEAAGHEVEARNYEPTCTDFGYYGGKGCLTCGKVLVVPVEVAPNGHTPAIIPGVAPTCSHDGLTQGEYCEKCGAELTAQQIIPALAHTDKDNNGICDVCNLHMDEKEPTAIEVFINAVKSIFDKLLALFRAIFGR